MADVKVRAFLQRNIGSAKMRLWLLPTHRSDLGWFRDLDFARAVREERMQRDEGQNWGAFENSFFGPEFQWVESMSGVYDERTLNIQFTRCTVPIPTELASGSSQGRLLAN